MQILNAILVLVDLKTCETSDSQTAPDFHKGLQQTQRLAEPDVFLEIHHS